MVGRWLSKEISLLPKSTIITAASTAMTVNYQQVYEVSRNDTKWKEILSLIHI